MELIEYRLNNWNAPFDVKHSAAPAIISAYNSPTAAKVSLSSTLVQLAVHLYWFHQSDLPSGYLT